MNLQGRSNCLWIVGLATCAYLTGLSMADCTKDHSCNRNVTFMTNKALWVNGTAWAYTINNECPRGVQISTVSQVGDSTRLTYSTKDIKVGDQTCFLYASPHETRLDCDDEKERMYLEMAEKPRKCPSGCAEACNSLDPEWNSPDHAADCFTITWYEEEIDDTPSTMKRRMHMRKRA